MAGISRWYLSCRAVFAYGEGEELALQEIKTALDLWLSTARDTGLEKFLVIRKTTVPQGRDDGSMTDIQYIYDAGGHKKSVIIPVELWERTLGIEPPRLTPCNPQEYYGIYRDLIKDPAGTARTLRAEWNRL